MPDASKCYMFYSHQALDIRNCSEFLVGGGMGLFGKKCIPPARSLRKILVPPPRSRCQKWVPPPGCWKLFRAAGANHAKGASRAAGELHERDILLCFVSFFVCVKNGYPPTRSLCKILVTPPRKPCQKRVPPPLAKGPPPPLPEILNSP